MYNMNDYEIDYVDGSRVEWARESFMLFGDGTFLHTPALSEQFYVNK